jgi:hypothetical protein
MSISRWIDDRCLPFARAAIVIGPKENLSGRSVDEIRRKTVVHGTNQRMGWQKRPRALRGRPKMCSSYY